MRHGTVEIREAGKKLHGVLIQEGRAATDRRELFTPGSIEWPPQGVGIALEHRARPVATAIPERQSDGRITIETRATGGIREAVAAGRSSMSIEFYSRQERRTPGGIREITRALVDVVALVPVPEYDMTAAEVRRRFFGGFRTAMKPRRRVDCKCPDGADAVEFGDDAFEGVEDLDVTAISRGAESVLASTATDSLRLRKLANGSLQIDLDPLDTVAGRRTRELAKAGQPVYARPLWDQDRSTFETRDGVAYVSSAWFKYLLVRPLPREDAGGLDALERTENRGGLVTVAPPDALETILRLPPTRQRIWL